MERFGVFGAVPFFLEDFLFEVLFDLLFDLLFDFFLEALLVPGGQH